MSVQEAVAVACRVRLRPVLMTSLATIIELLPWLLNLEREAKRTRHWRVLSWVDWACQLYSQYFWCPPHICWFTAKSEKVWEWIAVAKMEDCMIKNLLITMGALILVLASTPTPIHAQEKMHLTLAEAEKLAVKNNPHLATATLVAAAASQVPAEYRSAYFPTLFASATGVDAENGTRLAAGGLTNPIVYDHIGGGVTVNQMVTDFGRTGNLIDMAKLHADAQNQTAEQTRADILLITGQVYFGVLRAQAVLQVARQTVETRQLVADQVTALANSNLKSALDVSFANVNLADAKLLLVQSENSLKAVQAQLAAVLGLPGGTWFDLAEEPMPSQLPEQSDDLIQQAFQNRPDLKGLHLEQRAAEKFTSAEHALQPEYRDHGNCGFCTGR